MGKNVILVLGSNLGVRSQYLKKSIFALKSISIHSSIVQSPIYETPPLGPTSQNHYLNQCVQFETFLNAFDLLDFCKKTEVNLGRKQRPRWTSREIDIDILEYNNEIINTSNLHIPHKEITNRLFFLKPLADLVPHLILPNQTKSVQQLLSSFFPTHHTLLPHSLRSKKELVPTS